MRRIPVAKIVLSWCAAYTAAAEQPTFESGISLVTIDAEATDGTRSIENLQKRDFRVWDNDVPQEILYFYRTEEPLDLVLLFDVSGSMRPNVERVAASADAALAELHAGDRVGVMVFARKSRVLLPLSSDHAKVARTLHRDLLGVEFGGRTHLLAAIADASDLLRSGGAGRRRRAVLVFTDNYGLRSRSEGNVVTGLWELDVVVSGLFIRNPEEVKTRKVTRVIFPTARLFGQGMNGVVTKTGGDTLEVQEEPGAAFQQMVQRLRNRYLFYYAMPDGKPGELRRVRVELSSEMRTRYPKGQVRARRAYRVPAK